MHCDWLQHFCHRTKYAKLVAGIFYYSTYFKSPGTSANNHFIAAFNTRPKSQPAGGYYFRLQHVGLSVCGCVSSSFRVKWSNLLQIKTEILLLPRYMFNFERSKVSDAKMPKWNQDVSHRSLYHLFHCGLGHGKRSLHVGAQRSRSPLQIGRFTSRKSKIFLVGLYARCILVYFKVKCQSQGHKNDKIIFGHNSYRPT